MACVFRIGYESLPFPDITYFSVLINNSAQDRVTTVYSTDNGRVPIEPSGVIECVIPELMLGIGLYSVWLDCGKFDFESHAYFSYDSVPFATYIRIKDNRFIQGAPRTEFQGVLHRTEWSRSKRLCNTSRIDSRGDRSGRDGCLTMLQRWRGRTNLTAPGVLGSLSPYRISLFIALSGGGKTKTVICAMAAAQARVLLNSCAVISRLSRPRASACRQRPRGAEARPSRAGEPNRGAKKSLSEPIAAGLSSPRSSTTGLCRCSSTPARSSSPKRAIYGGDGSDVLAAGVVSLRRAAFRLARARVFQQRGSKGIFVIEDNCHYRVPRGLRPRPDLEMQSFGFGKVLSARQVAPDREGGRR